MVVTPMYPYYVKKEDARDVVIWQRRTAAFVLIAAALVFSIMQIFVSPKLLSLYGSLNLTPPAIALSSFGITFVVVTIYALSAMYLIFSKPDFTKVDNIAKKYKKGELIKTQELSNNKYLLVFVSFALMIAYFILSIILPIYNLTKNI